MTYVYRILTVFCLCLLLTSAVFAFADAKHHDGPAPVLGDDLAVQLQIPLFSPSFADLPVASVGATPILLKELWPTLHGSENPTTLAKRFKQELETRIAAQAAASGQVKIYADPNIREDGSFLVEIPLFSEMFPEVPVALVNDEPITVVEFSTDLQSVHGEMAGHDAASGSKENIERLMERLLTVRLIEQEARNIGFDQTSSFRKQAAEFAEKTLLYALLNKQLETLSLDMDAANELYQQVSLQGKFENYQFTREQDVVDFREKLEKSKDFDSLIAAAVANKQAIPSEQQDFIRFKDLLPNIASEAAQMKLGGISQTFRQADGFLIFKLLDRQFVEDPQALEYAKKTIWEKQKAEFATKYIADTVDRYTEFNEQAKSALDFEKIKQAKPDIQLGTALAPLLKDDRVLVRVKGPTDVSFSVADIARKIKENYFHGVDVALDAKEVDTKKQQIIDDTLFRIAGTFEAQQLGLDKSLQYRMDVAEFERRLLFDIFMAKVLKADVRYSEEDVQQYYQRHQAEYMTPAMFKFKSLPFYKLEDAEKAAAKLRSGSDFKWVSANSDGRVDVQNKDLLQFDRNILSLSTLPKTLQQQAAGVERGDSLVYSDPDNFYYVLYFEEVYPPQPRPYDQVRKDLLKIVYQEKTAETLELWVEKLKEAYETKIYLAAKGH